jgi:hypothetical protein
MLIFPLAGFVVKSLENTGSYTIASDGYRMRAPGGEIFRKLESVESVTLGQPFRDHRNFRLADG